MVVCIAEKPSVAKDLAKVLGANTPRDGYLEGNGYQVTWTFGHLCELKYPEDYTAAWKPWALSRLPMIPERFGIRLKDDQGVRRQFAVIERLMREADSIINCGDAGQEGELIQRWVMQKAGARCPVQRLWISSLTEEAIREGFASLRPQTDYQRLYEAGLCRAIGDWLLGFNATRLYTLKYSERAVGRPPLSIGRVQTPTLALIVRRQLEIQNFRPEPYWVLTTQYRDVVFKAESPEAEKAGGEETSASSPKNNAFTQKETAEAALARIREEEFRVTDVQKKNGTEAPPRLFDLTSLQVECNKKFGYSAETTLQLCQTLYEKKLLTYPRVDTTFLPDDVYPKCRQILNGIASHYADVLQPLRGAPLKKSKKTFDSSKVTDHHAIIPTGQAPQTLTDIERNVYDLVARRFIAAFYPDCRFATTTVLGLAADVAFRATAKVVLDKGWRAVFSDASASASSQGEEAVVLGEDFVVGESGPHVPSLEEKQTQPPKPYTEATLLRAMETAGREVADEELRDALKENGIGRPSTRAAIIETLFKRQYIRRERKNLIATPTGVELIGIIREELLKSAELTGIWERKLRQIEHGTYEAAQFVAEIKQMVTDVVQQVMQDASNRRVAATELPLAVKLKSKEEAAAAASAPKKKPAKRVRAGMKCPLCGEGKVLKGRTSYGCSRWREGCTWRAPFSTPPAK